MRDYMRKKHADPARRELTNTLKRTRHSTLKIKAIEYLGGACADCGGVYHQAAFDFHHLDPSTKELHPGQALSGKWEWAKAELDKCVLLCANCHRTRHASEQFN